MNGIIEVEVTDDRMEAYIRFLKRKEDEEPDDIDFDTVIEVLRRNRVVYGIKEETINTAIAEETFDKDYLVAEGIRPKDGVDADIEYKLNIESSMKPKLDEKGNVDYLNVDNYISVKAGEVLAVYIPPVRAVTGCNVFGKSVRGKDGKKIKMPNGKNTEILDDGVTIAAKIDGLLQMLGGKISVLPVLMINSDVDVSTGNIDFIGSVKIYGNVCAGMRIRSKGSVEVNGTVEAAMIETEGDVIINGGIKGMGKAIISAGGNVVSRYIEKAYVKAMGDITANSAVQSKLESEGKINITGTNGSIIGGTTKAAKSIICKKLGSHNYIPTVAEAGISMVRQEGMNELEMRIGLIRRELAKMNAVIDSGLKAVTAAQSKALEEIRKRKPQLEEELINLEEEYEKRTEFLKSNTRASITAIDYAYPEVTVIISGEKLLIKSEYQATTFYLHKDEISIKKCEVIED